MVMKKAVVILAISLFYSVNLFATQTDTEYYSGSAKLDQKPTPVKI